MWAGASHSAANVPHAFHHLVKGQEKYLEEMPVKGTETKFKKKIDMYDAHLQLAFKED